MCYQKDIKVNKDIKQELTMPINKLLSASRDGFHRVSLCARVAREGSQEETVDRVEERELESPV